MKDLETLPKLYIRGVIAPRGTLFKGESFSASDVRDFLQTHKDEPEIVAEISSDGGYKTEGIEIYNILKNSGKKITTISYKANSIATVIALSGSTRLIVENGQFIVHFARIDPQDLGINSLTSDDLQRLADETERADSQILDIYCNELGEEKRTELIAAMADERDLGAKGAIKIGFATGFYKKARKPKMAIEDFTGALITDHLALLIKNNMSKEKEEKDSNKSLEEKIMNLGKSISKLFIKLKNEVTLVLQDGSSIHVVPVDAAMPDELNGASVFKVDEAGLPTTEAVADGSYVINDGRTLVVLAGKVTEVKAVVDPNAAMKTELAAKEEALKQASAEIASLKASIETDKVEMKKQFDSIQNAFKEFKAAVPGERKKGTEEDDDKPVDFSKMSTAQRVRAMSKERAKFELNLKQS